MENMHASEPSHQDLFEEEIRTIMEALSTQVKGLHQNVTIMDEHQEAMYSMVRDMHPQFRHQGS